MKKQLMAEAHVLDRVLYLLEEGSVRHVMKADEQFADYVSSIYSLLSNKSNMLHEALSQ